MSDDYTSLMSLNMMQAILDRIQTEGVSPEVAAIGRINDMLRGLEQIQNALQDEESEETGQVQVPSSADAGGCFAIYGHDPKFAAHVRKIRAHFQKRTDEMLEADRRAIREGRPQNCSIIGRGPIGMIPPSTKAQPQPDVETENPS